MRNSFSESPLEVSVLPNYLKSVTCSISSPPSWIFIGELLIDIAFVLEALMGNTICSAFSVSFFRNY